MKRCALVGAAIVGLVGLAYMFYAPKGDGYISLIHELPKAQSAAEEKTILERVIEFEERSFYVELYNKQTGEMLSMYADCEAENNCYYDQPVDNIRVDITAGDSTEPVNWHPKDKNNIGLLFLE